MIEKIFNFLRPFLIGEYNDLLFKYDDKYKAISSEIDNIFQSNFYILTDNIKKYYKNNKKLQAEIQKQPLELRNKINSFSKIEDFEGYIKKIDFFEKEINTNFLIQFLIDKYLKTDEFLVEKYNNFINSILGFRKVFDEELGHFYSGKIVNRNILELHKKILLNSLTSLLELSDKKIFIIIQKMYKDFLPNILENPKIDSKKLENLHKSIVDIYDNVIKKENFKIYIYLEDYIEKCFSDIINLLIKK